LFRKAFLIICTVALYDRDPHCYQPELYQRRRTQLLNTFETTLSSLSAAQFELLRKVYLKAFHDELVAGLTSEHVFADLVKEKSNYWERKYEDSAREASVESIDRRWEGELELLKADIRKLVDEISEDAATQVMNSSSLVHSFNSSGTRHGQGPRQNWRREQVLSSEQLTLGILFRHWGN
jgi:hypothetical protein